MKFESRAAEFSREWADATYEKGEAQSFYNDFFEIFDVKRRSVARYEEHVKKLNNKSGFIDLFWPRVLLVEQKSAGHNLADAYGQAGDYFDALPERERPRYILVSDFQKFELHDLDTREQTDFTLKDLPFACGKLRIYSWRGTQNFPRFRIQRTSRRLSLSGGCMMHLTKQATAVTIWNVSWYEIVFCLFADDTGIFEPRNIFLDFIETRTREDGSDLGPLLTQLFQVLDTPDDKRSTMLDEDLAHFPYINGDLFLRTLGYPFLQQEHAYPLA